MRPLSDNNIAAVAKELDELAITTQTFAKGDREAVAIHVGSEIMACNQAFLDMTGYSRDEVIGHNAWMFFPPESVETVWTKLKEKAEGPYRVKGLRKTGETFDIEITAYNIPTNSDGVRAVVVRELGKSGGA